MIGAEKEPRIPQAHVDFEYSGTLENLAQELSNRIFGKIKFIGENTGIWDEVPAVRLAERFLGLEIELGGQDGSFALSMLDTDFPLQDLTADQIANAIVDISGYVAYLLSHVPDVRPKKKTAAPSP